MPTIAELEKELADINAQRDNLNAKAKSLAVRLDAARAQEAAAAKVAGMGDAEKLALAQVLSAAGVPSDEHFGTPGR